MKYIVIDMKDGDMFTEEFEAAGEAIERAKICWNHLTDREKKQREIYVLESVNPDEEAPDHFDGNTVWESAERGTEMTREEFMENVIDNAITPMEKMTVADAAADLENFRTDGWDIPSDMTAEFYAEYWNEHVVEMTIFGRKIENDDMQNIAGYMDDEIRERLHGELAPCTHEEFINAYLEADPDFEDLLRKEFDFER